MGGLFCFERQENFSMAKGNVQLEHECCPKHFRMEKTTMKRENNNNNNNNINNNNNKRTRHCTICDQKILE